MAEVHWTHDAEEDLIDIWRYIARHSPKAADRMLDRINDACEQRAAYPLLGTPRDDIATGVRSLRVGTYLVL